MKPNDKVKTSVFGHYFASHPEAALRIDNLHLMANKLNLTTEEVQPLPAVLNSKK